MYQPAATHKHDKGVFRNTSVGWAGQMKIFDVKLFWPPFASRKTFWLCPLRSWKILYSWNRFVQCCVYLLVQISYRQWKQNQSFTGSTDPNCALWDYGRTWLGDTDDYTAEVIPHGQTLYGIYPHPLYTFDSAHLGLYYHIGIAGLVVWYLGSGAQGPGINTWLGHSRLGLD